MLGPEVDEHVLARELGLDAERHPDGVPCGVHPRGRELQLDGAVAHSECGSLPRSPRRKRSFMSSGSSAKPSAIESSSME